MTKDHIHIGSFPYEGISFKNNNKKKKKQNKKKTSRQKCNKYKIYDNDSLYRLNFWWN